MGSQVQQTLMQPGWWDVDLTNLPDVIFQALQFFGEVYILPTEVDPQNHSKASLKSLSEYTGVLWTLERDKKTGNIHIAGPGNDIWLGKDGKGELFETALNYTAETFANVVNALIPDALTAGTISTPGGAGTYTGRAAFMDDPRAALARLMEIYGAEWRVNPDGTIDVGTPTQLGYTITPTAVAFPRTEEAISALDPDYRAITATSLSLKQDSLDFASKALIAGQGAGQTIILGSGTAVTTFKDPNGNALVWKTVLNEPVLSIDNADDLAQAKVDKLAVIRKVITIGLDRYVIGGDYALGDYIYVYSPPDVSDTDNALDAFGTMIHPEVIRLIGVTWPITPGKSVLFRDHSDNIHDLTPYLIPSRNVAPTLQVGDLAKPAIDVSVGNQSVLGRLSDDGGVPEEVSTVGHVVTQGIYLDHEGSSRAWVNINFPRQNLNTDGSTIADGMVYQIRYGEKSAVDAGNGYLYRSIEYDPSEATPEFDLYDLAPGADIYYSIRVKDYYGNKGAFHTNESVTVTNDLIAPSKPANPTCAGNPGTIMVKHTLAASGGLDYTLERDVAKLRVYCSETAIDFTPDPDPASGTFNLLGEIPISAANLELGIAAVGSFPVPNDGSSPDTERWVKVTAVDWSGNESTYETNGVSVTAELIAALWVGSLSADDITTGTLDASVVSVTNLNASNINTGTLDASVVTVSNLDASNINTGTLDADRIAAGSIYFDKLIANSSDNLIQDPSFDLAEAASPHDMSNDEGGVWSQGTANSRDASASGRIAYSSVGTMTGADPVAALNGTLTNTNGHVRCFEGEKFFFTFYHMVKSAAGATLRVRASLRWRKADGTALSVTLGSWETPTDSTYVLYAGVDGTAPADAGFVVAQLEIEYNASATAGTYYFDDCYLRRQVENSIVATGISADKITVGTLDASVVTVTNLDADEINTGTLDASVVTVSNLDAGNITAGTLSVDRIAANSLTIKKLILGSADNLIQDPGFEQSGTANDPDLIHEPGAGAWSIEATVVRSGGYSIEWDPTGVGIDSTYTFNGPSTLGTHPAATEGEEFFASVWLRSESSPVFAARLQLRYFDETGTYVNGDNGSWVSGADSAWVQATVTGTAPATTAFVVARVHFDYTSADTKKWWIDDAYLRLKVTNDIVASGISADKITVGTLDASVVTVSNLTASNITVGTLNNLRLPSTISQTSLYGSSSVYTGSAGYIGLGGSTYAMKYSGSITYIYGSSTDYFGVASTNCSTNNHIVPASDSSYNLGGSPTPRWNNVYRISSTNPSGRVYKKNIAVTDLGLGFINALTPRKFKRKDTLDEKVSRVLENQMRALAANHGVLTESLDRFDPTDDSPEAIAEISEINGHLAAIDAEMVLLKKQRDSARKPGGRFHQGFIAEEVKEAFTSIGAGDFGGFKDSTFAFPDDPQSFELDYEEFIAPMVRAIQELSEKVDRLEREANGR